MSITVREIVEKRNQIWQERHDPLYDARLVRASGKKLLETESLRKEVIEKPYLLIEVAFTVVDKKGKTVPFFFNEVQRDFIRELETRGTDKPFFILKGRQMGFTTLITAIQMSFAIVRRNFSGFTLANTSKNATSIFNRKARTVLKRLPDLLHPHEQFNSKHELFFDRLNSGWSVDTATDDVARSNTLHFVHYSEAAFFQCSLENLQASVSNALVEGAIQVYETTANGMNEAKELWDRGSCHNLFYGWWRTSEYRSTQYEYLDKADEWLEKRLKLLEEMGLDKEQRTWYAKKYCELLNKEKLLQEYPCSPEEAFIFGGTSVFNKEALQSQLLRIGKLTPYQIGFFTYRKAYEEIRDEHGELISYQKKLTDIEFVEDKNGYITLHEPPRVRTDSFGNVTGYAPYALGGDTAGDGSDYFTAKVVDAMEGRTAATLRKQRMDEDLYAEQIYCLGRMYHQALVGIETNYSRQPTRLLAHEYRYPNLYMRTRVDGVADTVERVYGFETTKKTKPVILAELVQRMREDPSIEPDRETLKEMSTFVRKSNGSQEALEGQHDDLVMALAIAHFVSAQQAAAWILPVDESANIIQKFFPERDQENSGMGWDDI